MTNPVTPLTNPTQLQLETYERLPFAIQAIRLTTENMAAVAEWCGGEIRTSGKRGIQRYIKVEVKRAINDRQTQAYVGDWVLKAGSGFKVYTPKAFAASFRKQVTHMVETVKNMEAREQAEIKKEAQEEAGLIDAEAPHGGSSFVTP